MGVHRIAIVTHGLETGGGVPAVAMWLAEGLERKGAEVAIHDLATSRTDEVSVRLVDPKSWASGPRQRPTRGVMPGTHWGAWISELEFMRYAPRRPLIETLDGFDTVQVVSGTPAWAVAVRGTKTPVALQVATTALWERQARWPTMTGTKTIVSKVMTRATKRLDRIGCLVADHVMVENAVMGTQVEAWGQRNVSFCPPGVDVHAFQPHSDGWNRDGDILSLGRLGEERKRFDRVLDAYAAARRVQPRLPTLRLAGRGRLPESHQRRIIELGLERHVVVDSDLAPDRIRLLLRNASVFLQASTEEGLGIAVLEAMASGLPVVTTETAGTRETVLDQITGRLVPQTATVVQDLATALVEVWSADRAATQGASGRHRVVDSFSTEVTLDRFWQIHLGLRTAASTSHGEPLLGRRTGIGRPWWSK